MKSPGTVQIQPPRVSRVPAIINQCSIPVAGAVNQQKPFEELSTRRGDSKEADSLSTFRTLKKTKRICSFAKSSGTRQFYLFKQRDSSTICAWTAPE